MPKLPELELVIYERIKEVDQKEWNSIVDGDNPFGLYEFHHSLEQSGCVGPATGWIPYHLCLLEKKNQNPQATHDHSANSQETRMAMHLTVYEKSQSYGEYIFDWNWAEFYSQNGLSYYPKGLVAVPFTPTNVNKLHSKYGKDTIEYVTGIKMMISGLFELAQAKQWSSLHWLFCEQGLLYELLQEQFILRHSHQYHWLNQNYAQTDDFLNDLIQKRRKDIRRERRLLAEQGLTISQFSGKNITEQLMKEMFDFYINTGSKKWGTPYLNERCFEAWQELLKENLLIVSAQNQKGETVAGSLNFIGGTKLYGRYWGCRQEIEFLHFECCYYQQIDYAIAKKLAVFEAGAQGEHKYNRGFAPVLINSFHHFFEPQVQTVFQRHLAIERNSILQQFNKLSDRSVLKRLRRLE